LKPVTRFLLDTTVLIEASRHREPALSWLHEALQTPDEVGVCAVIVAEFFAGLRPDERPRWESFIGADLLGHQTRDGQASGHLPV